MTEVSGALEMAGLTLRPGDHIGAYRYERPVGKGGMAHVLLGRDPDGHAVALKVLMAHRFRTGLMRFRREFRALARLNHENVIRVEAYGDIHGHPYIAMEFIEGTDLHQTIREFPKLEPNQRWARVEEVLFDLASALAYIHRRGLIHRDLKPSNILIDQQGNCKLTDFGIVKDLDPANDAQISTTLVGTWAYASPEQITGQVLDHRSDLYSLGILLFAMLTGRRPFVAKDMAGYLELHRDQPPPRPSDFDAEVPVHLEEICLKLLNKAPRDRFQSAREILFRLQKTEPENTADTTLNGTEVWEPPFVGRRREVGQIKDAVGALTGGKGQEITITGAQGTGKTRLLHVVLEHSQSLGVPIDHLRLAEGDAALVPVLQLARSLANELRDRVPTTLTEGIRLFSHDGEKQPGDLRYQLYDGIRDGLVILLGDSPRVFAIDNLQHAHGPLLDLLGFLLRSLVSREHRPLLVALAWSTDRPVPQLKELSDGTLTGRTPLAMAVEAFTHDELAMLLKGLGVGSEALAALADRLDQETQGNPFFLAESLRSLIQRGVLSGADAQWDLAFEAGELATGHFELPEGIRAVVRRRLQPLTPLSREVINLIAVAGREVDLDLMLDLFDDEDATLDALDGLVNAGLLVERRTGMRTLYHFAQTKVREVAEQELEEEVRASAHLRLAKALEARHTGSPMSAEAIGEHYRAAGSPGEAFRYLVLAAQRMWERSVLQEAWSLTERAATVERAAQDALTEDDYLRILVDMLRIRAEALFNHGDMIAAREATEALLREGEGILSRGEMLDAEVLLGAILASGGEFDAGHRVLSEVLDDARRLEDNEHVTLGLLHMASLHWLKGETTVAEELCTEGLQLAIDGGNPALRARLLVVHTAIQAGRGQLAAASAGLVEADEILRSLRNKRHRCLALCNLAEVLSWQGEFGLALQRSEDALSLSRDVLFRLGESVSHRLRAALFLELGDMASADVETKAALRIATRLGVPGAVGPAQLVKARLAMRAGRPSRAVTTLRTALGAVRDRDPEDYEPLMHATLALARAQGDQPQTALKMAHLAQERIPDLGVPRRAEVLLALARTHQEVGDPHKALQLARECAHLAVKKELRPCALAAQLIIISLAEAEEAKRVLGAARTLVRELLHTIPSVYAESYRNKPELSSLF